MRGEDSDDTRKIVNALAGLTVFVGICFVGFVVLWSMFIALYAGPIMYDVREIRDQHTTTTTTVPVRP